MRRTYMYSVNQVITKLETNVQGPLATLSLSHALALTIRLPDISLMLQMACRPTLLLPSLLS